MAAPRVVWMVVHSVGLLALHLVVMTAARMAGLMVELWAALWAGLSVEVKAEYLVDSKAVWMVGRKVD